MPFINIGSTIVKLVAIDVNFSQLVKSSLFQTSLIVEKEVTAIVKELKAYVAETIDVAQY
jgi:hypothetical protein